MRSFRFAFILTGFLILGLSALSSQALAHPHSHGKNPFESKNKGVSLHCLLKQHTNHLLKFCPHAQKNKEAVPTLTSACGKTPVSTPGAEVQKPVPPVTITASLEYQKHDRTTLLLHNQSPGTISLETASPPPRHIA